LATKAGCDVLKAGGTAVDAAVAVQAVLGLVEPQSSTIAGSAFMMYYDAGNRQVVAYDGREAAPGSRHRLLPGAPGPGRRIVPAPVPSARRSGRSIGVPGVMRMLDWPTKSTASWPGAPCLTKASAWPPMATRSPRAWAMRSHQRRQPAA
jgi:gamma-glutamyltranspeptidase/glutathione hydrolase